MYVRNIVEQEKYSPQRIAVALLKMTSLLAINFSAVLLQVGQLLLALSILVILHEFGHYITARKFGCRVEKFFLFFDWPFAIVKKKIGETVYGIGALPLGGYVKIAGMIDESMDKEQMKRTPQPWEFRSKPAWQRLIIMLGGIIMNVLTAFVIYAFIVMIWGDRKVPASSLKYGVNVVDSTLFQIGLRNGDRILAVNGKPVEDFEKIIRKVIVGNNITVDRSGKQLTFDMPVDYLGNLTKRKNKDVSSFLEPRIPVLAYSVADTTPAYKAGLRIGDRVIGIDSTRFQFFDEFRSLTQNRKNDSVWLTVLREQQEVRFRTKLDSEGHVGFLAVPALAFKQLDSLGWAKLNVTKYSFLSAFPAGVRIAKEQFEDYLDQFKKIVNPKTGGYKLVGGFKSMGSIFPKYGWDWETFWRITAFFSIVLAFMNLLPIPGLDGGHVLFTLCEMVAGRKLPEKFLEYAQYAGMAILLLLMLYANGNDWFGWGK